MAQNKTRQFEIPKQHIGSFFSQLDDSDLDYSLIGVDDENEELVISIEYSQGERDEVMSLIELLDEWTNEEEE
jgi:hypothetical protein